MESLPVKDMISNCILLSLTAKIRSRIVYMTLSWPVEHCSLFSGYKKKVCELKHWAVHTLQIFMLFDVICVSFPTNQRTIWMLYFCLVMSFVWYVSAVSLVFLCLFRLCRNGCCAGGLLRFIFLFGTCLMWWTIDQVS